MFNSISNNIQKSSSINLTANFNNEIKFLEKQKYNIQEQIDKISNSKMPDKNKQEMVKNLQEQIKQIDSQIQQEKIEEIKKNVNTENAENNKTNTNYNEDEELTYIETAVTYNKIKNISKIKSNIKSSSRILRAEAKLDEGRMGGGPEMAAKKIKKAEELEEKAYKIDLQVAKDNNKVNENNKVNKEEKEELNKNSIINKEKEDVNKDIIKDNERKELTYLDKNYNKKLDQFV